MEERLVSLVQQYVGAAWAQIGALWSRFPIRAQDLSSTVWATTSEIANVADTESAGTSNTIARGDHVHDLTDGMVLNVHIGAGAAITPNKFNLSHFSARRSANTAGVTGNGTTYTILFDSEDMDPGSNYATGTGVYTAPSTGAYNFEIAIGIAVGAAAQTQGILRLVTSARTYRWDFDPYTTRNSASGVSTISVSKICDMAANDTAYVTLQISGGPGDSAIVVGNTLTSAFSGVRVA